MSSLQVEELKVLNIDGKPIEVSSLSENVQKLVDIYNHFRQNEADAKIEMIKIQAAMRDISREIVTSIKAEEEAAAEESVEAVESDSAE